MGLGFKDNNLQKAKKRLAHLMGSVAPLLVLIAGTPAIADETLVPVSQITLPGKPLTSFDISFVNSQLGIYVLGDRSNKSVDVVNTRTSPPSLLYQAKAGFTGATGNNDTSGPDGVLIVNNKEIWVGDGDSTMKILSLSTGALVKTIPTGPPSANRVDEMCLDPIHGIVLAANNAADPPFGTFFSARTKQILGQVKFDGTNGTVLSSNGAEQCQWSPRTKKFYITIPETPANPTGVHGDNAGAVLQIDPVSRAVTGTALIDMKKCAAPQGMAIGPGSQILIGCNGNTTGTSPLHSVVIIDDGSGAPFGTILATIPNEVGADMVDYNSADDHYTLARSTPPGGAGNQVIGVIDATAMTADPDVITGTKPNKGSNHSIASDPVTDQYFMPIAGNSGTTLCSAVGGTDAQGCILVLKQAGVHTAAATCTAQGAPVISVGPAGPKVLTTACK